MNFDNTLTPPPSPDDQHAALDAAYARVRAEHEAGTCSASAVSCSACESEEGE